MNNQEALYKTNLSFIKQVLIVQLQPWKGSSDLAVALSHAGRFLAGSLSRWGCTEGWAAEPQRAKAWTNQARGEGEGCRNRGAAPGVELCMALVCGADAGQGLGALTAKQGAGNTS